MQNVLPRSVRNVFDHPWKFTLFVILPLLALMVTAYQQARERHMRDPKTVVPPGLQTSGEFTAEAFCLRSVDDYTVIVRRGDTLVPLSLSGPWEYPAGYGRATTELRDDALADEPIRVGFVQSIIRRDEHLPKLETHYVVHLHSVREALDSTTGQPEVSKREAAAAAARVGPAPMVTVEATVTVHP